MIMRETKFGKEYYYTLKDILAFMTPDYKYLNNKSMTSIAEDYFGTITSDHKGYYYNGLHANNLWQLLIEKFDEDFILKTDSDSLVEKLNEMWNKVFSRIFTRIEETYPKYDLLLTKYASTNDFFKQIENVVEVDGSNRFNDTPQIAEGYDADSYASNFSKSNSTTTSKSDGDSIMGRIAQVDMNYKNLLNQWCEEFRDLFIESLNII